MTDILLSSDEDEANHCVVKVPDELKLHDLEIVNCLNSRRKILQKTKFLHKGKIIEGRISLTRWNLRRVVFLEDDSNCAHCMQCVCPNCKCNSCEFIDVCNVWDH